jgi:hypothetical protein
MFKNQFGSFSFQAIQSYLFFGYQEKTFFDKSIWFASPEKAILDLLYLYPFYNNEEELRQLRFDFSETGMSSINKDILFQYLEQFRNKALENRLNLLLKVYKL